MGDLRAAPVVGPSGRGSAPPSRPNDLNSTTKITHSIFFYPSVSTFTSAATLFSQLCDQFMIIRNYAKDTDGLFARIIGKISALTILQYINYKNEKPIGRVKYALF